MAADIKTRSLTTEAWHTLIQAGFFGEQDRIELLNGEIVEMSPIGSKHAACVRRLEQYLGAAYRDAALVSSQNPIQAGEYSEPEPDVVVLKPRADFYAEAHPSGSDVFLVVEVAESSLEIDREIKSPIYAAAGISDYWIVNLRENRIEAFSRPEHGLYKLRELHIPGEFISLPYSDQTIDVRNLLP